ncbi:unnamed protein product [Timema podura]|uniref:C2H2-type domain-containing protein n=1 Tax=Timema podura TaxID=61482 RepID=A0ABN7NJ22_TIMPD|nr:unnamed protein product [Timema podura]
MWHVTLLFSFLVNLTSTERPYKCQICNAAFRKTSHLKQHVRQHTGERPYTCMECNKSFISNGVLKVHIRTHQGIKMFKCKTCNNLFSTNGSLKRHMGTQDQSCVLTVTRLLKALSAAAST